MRNNIKRFSDQELTEIRNKIPIKDVIEQLCGLECKQIEGYQRFLCPICSEMNTSLHPTENLGRCFSCNKNFNPIDFVMQQNKLPFMESVSRIKQHFLSS